MKMRRQTSDTFYFTHLYNNEKTNTSTNLRRIPVHSSHNIHNSLSNCHYHAKHLSCKMRQENKYNIKYLKQTKECYD